MTSDILVLHCYQFRFRKLKLLHSYSTLFIANFERVFVEYGHLIKSFEIIKSVQKMEKVITLGVSNKNTTCEWITQNLIQSSHRGIVSHWSELLTSFLFSLYSRPFLHLPFVQISKNVILQLDEITTGFQSSTDSNNSQNPWLRGTFWTSFKWDPNGESLSKRYSLYHTGSTSFDTVKSLMVSLNTKLPI